MISPLLQGYGGSQDMSSQMESFRNDLDLQSMSMLIEPAHNSFIRFETKQCYTPEP